ncbi:Abra [Caligus rogercresseyi]|uniref:Abra n=1 Tax=Caligus rogercresseyi TaxID=217165 RepID=A0A7T8KJ92_CALRO|nr:Abra [Caligus rogercresseyi]
MEGRDKYTERSAMRGIKANAHIGREIQDLVISSSRPEAPFPSAAFLSFTFPLATKSWVSSFEPAVMTFWTFQERYCTRGEMIKS